MVGPTDSGHFRQLSVCSIQRNRSACRVLRAGQAATLALGDFDRSLLRKVRAALAMTPAVAVWDCPGCFLLYVHAPMFDRVADKMCALFVCI